MAITTKKEYVPRVGKMKKGGEASGGVSISDMNFSELRDYLREKYSEKISSVKKTFSFISSDETFSYDFKDPRAKEKMLEYYNSVSDYSSENMDESIYKVGDDNDLFREITDPESGEVIDEVEIDLLDSNNTYNSDYLGEFQLDYSLFYDDELDQYIYLTKMNIGDDVRGEYSNPFMIIGDDREDLTLRHLNDFIIGEISIAIGFKDGSQVVFNSESEFEVPYFYVSEVVSVSEDSMAKEYLDDFVDAVPENRDEFLDVTLHVFNSLNKFEYGGELTDEDSPTIKVRPIGYEDDVFDIEVENYQDGEDVFADIEEWLETLNEFDKGKREQFEFFGHKGFGSKWVSKNMSESDFDELITAYEAFEESDYPLSVIRDYMSDVGVTDMEDAIRSMNENYYGTYNDLSDLAEQWVSEGIYTPQLEEMYVTDTDKRLLAGDMADSDISNASHEDIVRIADKYEEYEESKSEIEDRIDALNDRKDTLEENLQDLDGDDYDVTAETIADIEIEIEEREEEMSNLIEKLADKYRDDALSVKHEEYENKIENNLKEFLDELGYEKYSEISFLRINYEDIAEKLKSDFYIYDVDGDKYVFKTVFAKGGVVKHVGKAKTYPCYIFETTSKRIVKGCKSKPEGKSMKTDLSKKHPKYRFSIYTKNELEDKYGVDASDYSNWKNENELRNVSIHRVKKGLGKSSFEEEYDAILKDLHMERRKLSKVSKEDRQDILNEIEAIKDKLRDIKRRDYLERGIYSLGAIARGAKNAGRKAQQKAVRSAHWINRQWEEADFGDGSGKTEFENGGEVELTYHPNQSNSKHFEWEEWDEGYFGTETSGRTFMLHHPLKGYFTTESGRWELSEEVGQEDRELGTFDSPLDAEKYIIEILNL